MADTVFFDPTTLGRPVKDLLRQEVRQKMHLLELQLNTDRDTALTDVPALQTEQAKIVAGDVEYTGGQDITDNTAFDLFTIPVPDEAGVVVEVVASVFVDDGTDHQVISLHAHIKAVNKGGSLTAVVTELLADLVAASSGTLTLAFAAAEGDDNILNVSITADSSLTPSTMEVDWVARVIRGGAITPVNDDA